MRDQIRAMISRINDVVDRIRPMISRNHFVVWLLRMSRAIDCDDQRGLIIIQIDGLGHTQLRNALDRGTMPFAKHLLEKEDYQLHSVFTGIPSSTPAAQGELFYGVKACVPAFRFKRPQDDRTVVMLDPEVAR